MILYDDIICVWYLNESEWYYVVCCHIAACLNNSNTLGVGCQPNAWLDWYNWYTFLLFYYLSVQMNTGYYGLDVSRHLASTTTLSALGKNYVALNL
jgi:hypothetical protein